jgi:hypothetical protein
MLLSNVHQAFAANVLASHRSGDVSHCRLCVESAIDQHPQRSGHHVIFCDLVHERFDTRRHKQLLDAELVIRQRPEDWDRIFDLR